MVAIERFMRTVDPESYCEFTEEEKKKSGGSRVVITAFGPVLDGYDFFTENA